MLSATNEALELRGAIVFNYLRMYKLIIIYFIYFFAGANRLNTCEELKNWMLSTAVVINIAVLWHVFCGHWGNKERISEVVTHVKCYFAINY